MTFSHAWTLSTPGNKLAALANGGVFVESNGTASFYSPSSTTPVWTAPPVISFSSKIDAGANTLAAFRFQMATSASPRIPVLTRYALANGAPLWSYAFPLQVNSTTSGVHVSQDGSVVVAWVFTFQVKPAINTAPPTGQVVDVAVFDQSSATPLRYFSVYMAGQPRASAISKDGKHLLLLSGMKYVQVNLTTGALVLDGFNSVDVGSACAVSENGQTIAIARSKQFVDVYSGGVQQASISSSNTIASAVSVKLGAEVLVGWSDGAIYVGTARLASATGMRDCDVSPDGTVIASTSGGPTIFERAGSAWSKSLEQNIVGTNDIDVSNDLAVTVAGARVDLFKRGGAAPVEPTEYRCTIPYPAVQGSVHTATAFPIGSGPPIMVRVE